MYKNKSNSHIGIILTIIVIIILVLLTNVENNSLSMIENVAYKVISPIQNAVIYTRNKIQGNTSFFTDIKQLKEENTKLKEENTKLEQSLREFEILKTENETLKKDLELSQQYEQYKTIPGYVINRDISNYSNTLVINVGKNYGIEENMTVISSDGLVGHIISVTDKTSKVQTIVDTSSSTSAILGTSRDSIVCKGTLGSENVLKAIYLPVDENVVEGDSVETSGIGGIYQKGIHIGKVSKVVKTSNETDKYALIETSVNFNKLENVLVIKK